MKKALILAVLAALLVTVTPSFAQTSDLKTNFLASNPNNSWEYVFLNDNGEFIRYDTTFEAGDGIVGWALSNTPGFLRCNMKGN